MQWKAPELKVRHLTKSGLRCVRGKKTGLFVQRSARHRESLQSVSSAASTAFLLAFWEPDRFTLDKLLNRLRN
jgi:hypothetical protein